MKIPFTLKIFCILCVLASLLIWQVYPKYVLGQDSPVQTTGTLSSVQHTYSQTGTYTVSLRVTDGLYTTAHSQNLALIPKPQYGYYLPIMIR